MQDPESMRRSERRRQGRASLGSRELRRQSHNGRIKKGGSDTAAVSDSYRLGKQPDVSKL